MPIKDLANKVHTNDKICKQAENFIVSSIESYFESPCYTTLKDKMGKLNDSIDMRFGAKSGGSNRIQNAFRSKIAIPLVREGYLARQAILSQAFSNPPLVTILPDNVTPYVNAKNMNDLITTVLRNTRYHQRTLEPVIENAARYGTAVVVSYYDSFQKAERRTRPKFDNGQFAGYEKSTQPRTKSGVFADCINNLNYFQQADEPLPYRARYRGYVERVPLHVVQNEAKELEDVYIKETISKIISEAQKGNIKSEHFKGGKEEEKAHILYVDRYHWYGILDMKDNRDDDTTYYAQIIDGKLVRFQENPHDDDIIPIDIFTLYKRPEYWWASTDAENLVPMENYLQFILSMTADSAMMEMQRYIFYDAASGLDMSKINETAKAGGFIPYNSKEGMPGLKDLFFQAQFPGISLQTVSYMTAEMKEAAQRVRPKGDFTRQPNQGGMKNKTAYAANVITQQGNTLEAYPLRMFGYGLCDNIRTMTIILQQRLEHRITVRPVPTQNPIELLKYEIMGDYNPVVSTTLTNNQADEIMRLFNLITGVQNFKGSGDPTWLRFNLAPAVRKWTKEILQNSVDVDTVYPEQTPQELQAYQQQLTQPQMAPGMMPGMPPGMMPMGAPGPMQKPAAQGAMNVR